MQEISNEELLRELDRRLSLNTKTILVQQDTLVQMQELNRKLGQSEALKSHFISNIKNEINNPLASILALSQNILRKRNTLPEDAVKGLQLINHEAHSLNFQLDNIMTAAEIEAGSATPELVLVNISHVVEQCVNSFVNLTEKRKLKINIVGDEPVHFVTDSHYFKIIASNLISNAIKFSREGSTISIHLAQYVDHLSFTVADAGNRIPDKDLSKIFDRFTQLDSGTIKKYQGHGLGLSVIKDLAELLEGFVQVKSGELGSVFIVQLPAKVSDDESRTLPGDGAEVLFDQTF